MSKGEMVVNTETLGRVQRHDGDGDRGGLRGAPLGQGHCGLYRFAGEVTAVTPSERRGRVGTRLRRPFHVGEGRMTLGCSRGRHGGPFEEFSAGRASTLPYI